MSEPDVMPVIVYLRHRAEPLRLDFYGPDYEGLADELEKREGMIMFRCAAGKETDLVFLRVEDIQAVVTDVRSPRTAG